MRLSKWKFAGLLFIWMVLFFLVPVSEVQAANGTIGLNETKTVTLGIGETVTYSFTPEESGEYALWMDQPAIAIMGIQMDFHIINPVNGEEVKANQENHQVRIYSLFGGDTYELMVRGSFDAVLTRSFGIRKTSISNSLSFASPFTNVNAGESNLAVVNPSSPEAVAGTFTWNSSNPNVASVEIVGKTHANLYYLSAGTSTITVSNGVTSCSYTVTVTGSGTYPGVAPNAGGSISSGGTPVRETEPERVERVMMELEKEYLVNTNGHYFYGLFTPTESGLYYMIRESSDLSIWLVWCGDEIVPERGSEDDGDRKGENVYHLEAGKTYEIVGESDYITGDKVWMSKNSAFGGGQLEETESAQEESAMPGAIVAPPGVDVPMVEVNVQNFWEQVENADEGAYIRLNMIADEGTVLDKEAMKLAADRGMVVEIVTGVGSVVLNQKMLETISQFSSGENVQVLLKEVSENELSEAQKESLKDYAVELTVSADIISDGIKLHDFEGGDAVVRLSYGNIREGTIYRILYVAEDGSTEEMAADIGDGYIEFGTGHFSTFALVSKGVTEEMPIQGPNGLILIGIGAVVVAAAAVLLLIKKKRIEKHSFLC